MAVESTADRRALLADFGVPATVSPGGATVVGIFENAHAEEDAGFPVSTTAPTFTVEAADAAALADGATLTILGTVYAITDPQPDGTGLTTLRLRE